jgi:outer membrane protein
MKKQLFLFATFLFGVSALSADEGLIGVVNANTCFVESKAGKKEQESLEGLRKQMSTMIEDSEKELKELSAKFEDTEFLDSLSPKAEEELKLKYQTLQEDLNRYQGQFYQVLQQAQYQVVHRLTNYIAKASEEIAKEKNLSYVINKEACFYIRSDLEVTQDIISQMDKHFELEKKLSENDVNVEKAS